MGGLPPFDSIDDANELLDALVKGLWNDLTLHQKRSQPFRVSRMPIEPTAANLGQYGLVRLQELDGFIEGLFNGGDAIGLPERAHEAVGHLAELRAMMLVHARRREGPAREYHHLHPRQTGRQAGDPHRELPKA